MYFPTSLKQARLDQMNNHVPEQLLLPNNKKVHFINKFKYLGSIITLLLNKDAETHARIKKAKSIMRASKYFFDNRGVDRRIKAEIYVAGPLSALLWGCTAWNLMKDNLKKTMALHHGAIRRILGIWWNQVREQHIKNQEIRGILCNIPNVNAFIDNRVQPPVSAKCQDRILNPIHSNS